MALVRNLKTEKSDMAPLSMEEVGKFLGNGEAGRGTQPGAGVKK